jgi:hypothetical protein
MGDLEMFFPDRSALKFTDDGMIEGDWLDCDGCNTPQLVNGGIVSDQFSSVLNAGSPNDQDPNLQR